MSRRNIVDAALDLERELEEFDRTKDPSVLIKALQDQFMITRYDSATLVETGRIVALAVLIGRMSKMSDNYKVRLCDACRNGQDCSFGRTNW
jgi:hypothetical protein